MEAALLLSVFFHCISGVTIHSITHSPPNSPTRCHLGPLLPPLPQDYQHPMNQSLPLFSVSLSTPSIRKHRSNHVTSLGCWYSPNISDVSHDFILWPPPLPLALHSIIPNKALQTPGAPPPGTLPSLSLQLSSAPPSCTGPPPTSPN